MKVTRASFEGKPGASIPMQPLYSHSALGQVERNSLLSESKVKSTIRDLQ